MGDAAPPAEGPTPGRCYRRPPMGTSSRRMRPVVVVLALGVGVCMAAIAAGCSGGEPTKTLPSGPTPRAARAVPYDPTITFKQPMPADPELDPRSAAIAGQLAANRAIGTVDLSSRSDVPPIYVVRPGDPFYSVTVGGRKARFRVPAGAEPGGGEDHPLVLLDPDHPDYGPATELRLLRAEIDPATRTLTGAGAGLFHYNDDGRILNPDGTRSLAQPFAGVGTGSGLSIMAGLIRPEEVEAGVIRHALRFAYSASDFSDRFRAPAIKTDQPKNTTTRDPATAMDMGMRLQLDPSVDCDARTVPGESDTSAATAYLRMICHALQDYGMIAVDGTGDRGLALMMEDSTTADWPAILGDERFGSYSWIVRDEATPDDHLSRDASSGIPWDRFRVLKLGVPRPMPARTTSSGAVETR